MKAIPENDAARQNVERGNVGVRSSKKLSSESLGFCYALCSALFYTVSLTALRGLTDYDVSPYWSLAVKELVCVLSVCPIIFYLRLRGKYRFPKWNVFWTLVAAGISCEAIGSIQHLNAYAFIGLALASPLIQASQLIFSSIVGSVWLKERVSRSKFVALCLLIVAVFLLSQSGESGEIAGRQIRLGLGIFCTLCTALGYCGQLSLMRRVLRSEAPDNANKNETKALTAEDFARTPTSLVMVTITGVGVVVCGILFTMQQGFHAWIEPSAECWKYVITAGFANMFGFFCQIESIRRLYVLKQALVATMQTATLCLLGVVMFGEPFGFITGVGLALVLAGVFISGMSK